MKSVIDWDAIREEYVSRVPVKVIAEKYDVNEKTIWSRASSKKWRRREPEETDRPSSELTDSVQELLNFRTALAKELRVDFMRNYANGNSSLLAWNKALIRSNILGYSNPEEVIRRLEEEAEAVKKPPRHEEAGNRISKEKAAEIADMLLQGVPNEKVAQTAGVSNGTVERIRWQLTYDGKIEPSKKDRLPLELKMEVTRLSREGYDAVTVAALCGVTKTTVYRLSFGGD